MSSTSIARPAFGIVLVLLLCGGLVPPAVHAQATASPVPVAADAGSLAGMLGRLPDRPLLNGAVVNYADVARQTTALGVDSPRDAGDEEAMQRWIAAIMPLSLPQATGRYWTLPEWREAFGFDLFQVEQAVEYGGAQFELTVLRGTFDPAELRAAWARGGYQAIDLGAGEAYAVREDHEIAITAPGGRMAMSYLNVVALAADGTLIMGNTRDGVREALAVATGTAPSLAGRADIAPLVRAAPPDLVSAVLVDGDALHALPDPAEMLLGDESPEDFATRVAAEQVEARRLPPVAAVLLGRTAGLGRDDNAMATPAETAAPSAQLVVALSTIGPDAAETAAAVIAERLATGQTSPLMSGELADRAWTEIFPEREVRAVSGEPAVLIELVPAPGVSPFILQSMVFTRMPGFLAWAW